MTVLGYYYARDPQGESVMALLDIFQSVKTGIEWKWLRYCVIDQSSIQRDWVNLAWTWISGNFWAWFVRKTIVKAWWRFWTFFKAWKRELDEKLRYCVTYQSGIQRDWVNLGWAWISENFWAWFVRKIYVKAGYRAPFYWGEYCIYSLR